MDNKSNGSLITSVKSYDNAELLKKAIFSENRNKSGIYRWTNNLNKNTYVGSGADLAKRIGDYYNESELIRNPRPIHLALLKYKHNNFTLEILEHCFKDKLIEREQYYLDLLNLNITYWNMLILC